MRQLLFMYFMYFMCSIAALYDRFWCCVPYMVFALLQPQYHWDWSLPPDVRWSYYAALMAILLTLYYTNDVLKDVKIYFIDIVVMLYIGILYISVKMSVIPEISESWWAVIYSKVFTMYLIIRLHLRQRDQALTVMIIIYLCLAYLTYHYNWLFVFEDRNDLYWKGLGVFDNNHASLLLCMAIGMAYGFFVCARKWYFKVIHAVVAISAMHAVMFSFSRGAMLSAISGILWIVLCHRPKWQLIIAIPLLSIAISILAGKEVRERFISIQEASQDESAKGRVENWHAAMAMMQEKPLHGKGIRSSMMLSSQYGGPNTMAIHNHYAQVGADSGVIALGLYLIIIITTFYYMIRLRYLAYKNKIPDQIELPLFIYFKVNVRLPELMLGFQGAFVSFMVGSFFLSLEGFEIIWFLILSLTTLYNVMVEKYAVRGGSSISPAS